MSPGWSVESHHRTAGIRAADLTKAGGNEEAHRPGEQRRAARPFRFEGGRVDRVTLNRGRTVLLGVSHSCVEQCARHADAPKTLLDSETRDPPCAVIVGQHAPQRPIGQDARYLVPRHDPCPPGRQSVHVRDQARRYRRGRHLESQCRAVVTGFAAIEEASAPTPGRIRATTPERRHDVVPEFCRARSCLDGHHDHIARPEVQPPASVDSRCTL